MREKVRAATVVKDPWKLLRSQEQTFRLRNAPIELRLRPGRDLEILGEVFGRHCYRPPRDIEARSVLDLGANVGLFSAYALSFLGAERIVAVEPEPDNLRLLNSFARDRPIEVIDACAGTSAGVARLETGRAANSRVSRTGDHEVAVIDALSLGRFDLLKVDIEGAEWPLLTDERFSRIARAVVIEWHSRGCPRPDAKACAWELLEGHGMSIVATDDSPSGSCGLIWAVSEGPRDGSPV